VPHAARSVSYFIPNSAIVPIDTTDAVVRGLFADIFYQTGRVSHLDRILAWHPSYLEIAHRTYNLIMRDPGPLQLHIRNYIAILVSELFFSLISTSHNFSLVFKGF